jgi:hypothetical protein
MKPDEKIAKAYLEHLEGKEIEYEPDGNIPPDFLLNQEIAIEVRRLNQNFKINDRNVPVEKLEYKILQIVRVLETIKNDSYDYSILFSIKYKRPLKIDKKLLNEIEQKVIDVIKIIENTINIVINNNLLIKLTKSPRKYSEYFSLLSITDMDTGGLVHQIVYNNLKISLQEKENKIRPYFKKYQIWWLILIDHVGFMLKDYDFDLLNKMPILECVFDKIIVVSYFDPKNSHEILTKKASA